MKVVIDKEIQLLFPNIKMGYVLANVEVKSSDKFVLSAMDNLCANIMKQFTPELIREQPIIKLTKSAYRKLGKDPNRYRPSAESLMRRVASGKGLYRVNNVVDVLNMVSIETGFSIGGYDADSIQGEVHFSRGGANEPYEGIGRGDLNIENLPVFRDDWGAFGSPTSDSIRTMVTPTTKRFFMIFPAFERVGEELNTALTLAAQFLNEWGGAKDITSWIE